MYDFLIVGAGLFGCTLAERLKKKGADVCIIEKRKEIGGNCYTYIEDGIVVHKYGAHIFHTDSNMAWDYMNKFCVMNRFVNSPIAMYNGKAYNLPFNMNTFSQVFGVSDPEEAKQIIDEERKEVTNPTNLEEQAISLVGRTIYEMFIKCYTEKQWGRPCTELPPEIIKRIPVRFTFDNDYFNDRYEGIPECGYTPALKEMIRGVDTYLSKPFDKAYEKCANKIVYTGKIDEYFDYRLGKLEYRSLNFRTLRFDTNNMFGNAVMNMTDSKNAFTRIIEHKHFNKTNKTKGTIVTFEFPRKHDESNEPFYPVNNVENDALFAKYKELAAENRDVIFAGRTGEYKYYDMDDTILKAIELSDRL